jgi:cupin 2 domain-containing protein
MPDHPLLGNLFSALPEPASLESFQDIVSRPGCRIERIVSYGHASPAGFWYDQDWDEWVLVLQGRAVLAFDGIPDVRQLQPGDHCMIPAGTRHRVESTDAGAPTVWLAIHFDEPRGAGTTSSGVP